MSAKKLKLLGSFAVLLSLAFAVSCKGFFVNPTVTSMAIGPANLARAQHIFSDGRNRDL